MRSLKTLVVALCVSFPGLAAAETGNLLRDFSACAGRYSAKMEHQWLMGTPGAEASAARRAMFVDLIDALMPGAQSEGVPAARVLHWRIEAKFAQARLLQVVAFGDDAEARGPAEALAEHHIAVCDDLLLSG